MDLGSRAALPYAARSDSAEAISAVIPDAVSTVRTFRHQARLQVVISPQAKIASKHSERYFGSTVQLFRLAARKLGVGAAGEVSLVLYDLALCCSRKTPA